MGDVKCQECKPDDVMVTFENGIFKKVVIIIAMNSIGGFRNADILKA